MEHRKQKEANNNTETNNSNNMGITAKQSEKQEREYTPAPQGNHIAICYQIIEIGTEKKMTAQGLKEQKKVRLTWELTNELMADGKPYSVGADYTLSMYKSAILRRDVENWIGKKFTDEEAEVYDISKLINQPCMLNVVHNVSAKNGKTYANVSGVTPLAKGVPKPTQIDPGFVFSFDPWDDKKFASLPEWIKKRIEQTPEFKARLDGPHQNDHQPTVEPDDLPF